MHCGGTRAEGGLAIQHIPERSVPGQVDVSTKFNVQLDLSELSTLLDQHLNAQVCTKLARHDKILNRYCSKVVLPDTDSRTVFRTSIAPVSKRSKDPAQPRRHKITCAADVMAVLDDLNEQVARHQPAIFYVMLSGAAGEAAQRKGEGC